MEIQSIKQRFGIIGNSNLLERAIGISVQVAGTDMSVLITGESGSGKEVFPQIIHSLSSRKHGQYIAVNCGAIPEGTIDSELFGHEKGSFTGAHEARKGYFEVADGGTIFLDEVAELPLSTQVRLLRVLESGEFMRVGSSKVIKTNVRIVAATNVNVSSAISRGKFREDLYYRLNTVPIQVPSLRERKEDIYIMFRKFASEIAERYRMPMVQLNEEARVILTNYRWPGNVRQLKNVTEQLSVIESERIITPAILRNYLTEPFNELPALYNKPYENSQDFSERELMYKILFEMRRDINDMKKIIADLMLEGKIQKKPEEINTPIIQKLYDNSEPFVDSLSTYQRHKKDETEFTEDIRDSEIIEESLSLEGKEKDFIKRALQKNKGRRKKAATELGISERTLYRKIKEYGLEE